MTNKEFTVDMYLQRSRLANIQICYEFKKIIATEQTSVNL